MVAGARETVRFGCILQLKHGAAWRVAAGSLCGVEGIGGATGSCTSHPYNYLQNGGRRRLREAEKQVAAAAAH